MPLITLFMALATQWDRAGAIGARVGLKYEVVPFVAEQIGVELNTSRFFGLRVMEAAALDAWARQR